MSTNLGLPRRQLNTSTSNGSLTNNAFEQRILLNYALEHKHPLVPKQTALHCGRHWDAPASCHNPLQY